MFSWFTLLGVSAAFVCPGDPSELKPAWRWAFLRKFLGQLAKNNDVGSVCIKHQLQLILIASQDVYSVYLHQPETSTHILRTTTLTAVLAGAIFTNLPVS